MKLSRTITLFVMIFALPAIAVLFAQADTPDLHKSLCIAWSGSWFLAFLILAEWRFIASMFRLTLP